MPTFNGVFDPDSPSFAANAGFRAFLREDGTCGRSSRSGDAEALPTSGGSCRDGRAVRLLVRTAALELSLPQNGPLGHVIFATTEAEAMAAASRDVVTVPFDIVTFPLQALLTLYLTIVK